MTEKRQTGLVMVYTGDGKGKTTAALGMLLRAWGQGMRITVMQFVKSPDSICGEHKALQKLGLEVVTLGSGFTWIGNNMQKNRTFSRELWEQVKIKISSGKYDMLILDEFTYALKFGWIPVQEVMETLKNRPSGLHVIITGREASQEITEYADTVMEIRSLKHHLYQGVPAQKGIEF
jgi:cob(I)alamin adenosyltransferase